jgi:ATP-dependent Clp protease ATP-binding subunit ClpA
MANHFPLPIWTVYLTFSEDIRVVSPLLIPETLTANESPDSVAQALINRLEEIYLKLGDYQEILLYTPNLSLHSSQLKVFLEAPRKHPLYPDLEIAFDYFYTQLPNQHYLGFIPALGIEGYAETQPELVTALQSAVELEFSRKKRLMDVRQLITTQWYKKAFAQKHILETRFHNLSELAHLHQHNKERQWLSIIAQSLKRLQQPRCFGRDKELEQMLRALTGKYSRNILLVGRAGVGKTALVEEVYRVGNQKITFWETTAARMLQKLTVDSGWEESLGLVLEELSQRGDILYVRNLAQLFEVGAYVGNPISMAEFMREHLALGSVRLITECTDEELATIEARAPGYTNLFQVLRIEPPPVTQQSDIVHQRLRASHPKQVVPKQTIEETLRLQHRYALYSGFPGKTVHFLESLLNQQNDKTGTVLKTEAVVTRFCEESGMPRFLVDSRTNLELEKTRQFFQSRLFGQDAAIDIVVNLLASVKTRLTRPGKPIASLLFVGPTGVGKTELAKALTEFMFSDSDRLIRFDMSEFSDEIAVLRLTGDLMGGQGLLTDKIRQQPFSVVLFDELEKAHFAFYDLLLQIMGEGRLTDARGQVADFCSSVIIMTSNIGAGVSRQRSPGFHEKDKSLNALHQHYLHAVQQFFRPELFNRLDQVIPFNALDLSVLRPIVSRELDKIIARDGLRTRDVTVHIEDDVIDVLAQQSGDSHYGARQLQRGLHEQVVIPLATTLNRYSFSTSMKITVSQGENGLDFKTMIYTQKARADQTLADSKWTLRELTAKVSQNRRLAQLIDESPAMNQLWSKWDLLERDRRRLEQKFWQEPLVAYEYGAQHKHLSEAARLLELIKSIEIDCSLAFIGIKPPHADLATALKNWQKEHQAWQVLLLDLVQPETGQCIVSIYGASDYLTNIVEVFYGLIENKSWIVTERAVWLRHNEEKYIYTDSNDSPKRPGDKLVGLELQIVGAGAVLYFAEESGVHIWIDPQEKEHPYAVLIAQCTMKKFKTPPGIHRKKFLEALEKRRQYRKNGFFDFLEKTIHTGSNWQFVLEKQLDNHFQELLQRVLCGDVLEIDQPFDDEFSDDDDDLSTEPQIFWYFNGNWGV